MKKNKVYTIVLSTLTLLPVISFAANGQGLSSLLTTINSIVALILPIMFGVAVIYFFWSIGQFILHSDDPKVREEGKQKMLWGIVAMFVLISIYGIIKFIGSSLGISQTSSVGGGGGGGNSGGDPGFEGGQCPGGGGPPC